MRILKNTIPLLALALFSFSSCNTTNGLQKRMKNKTKKKCDCPGWSMERVEENSPIIS